MLFETKAVKLSVRRRISLLHTHGRLLAGCLRRARDEGWSEVRQAIEIASRVEARLGNLQRRADEVSRQKMGRRALPPGAWTVRQGGRYAPGT